MATPVALTLIGGPTALIEIAGFRLLTDLTFDQPGSYQSGPVRLDKTEGPAESADGLGQLSAVLLSHDQHFDNLDRAGRAFSIACRSPSRPRRVRSASARTLGR